MSYELTVDLHGGRVEIEADSMEDLEAKLHALDVGRLESLIAEKRVAVAPAVAPAKGARKPAKKASRKRAKSAKKTAGKAGKKKGTRTPTGAE